LEEEELLAEAEQAFGRVGTLAQKGGLTFFLLFLFLFLLLFLLFFFLVIVVAFFTF
jgi:hypothetical protein